MCRHHGYPRPGDEQVDAVRRKVPARGLASPMPARAQAASPRSVARDLLVRIRSPPCTRLSSGARVYVVYALLRKATDRLSLSLTFISVFMEIMSAVFMARTQCELETLERRQNRLSRFHIHGWRWHQAALVRDAKRFESAVRKSKCDWGGNQCSAQSLNSAVRWLLDTNLRDFRLVQNEVFLPFLQKNLPTETFAPIQRTIERHDRCIQELEKRIRDEVEACAIPSQCPQHRQRLEQAARLLSRQMEQAYTSQQLMVIATVAERIPTSVQRGFEEQVRRRLSMEQKRLHVVSFHEAIKDDPEELARFKATLPAPVRLLLGNWRKRWYLPATRQLDSCVRREFAAGRAGTPTSQ